MEYFRRRCSTKRAWATRSNNCGTTAPTPSILLSSRIRGSAPSGPPAPHADACLKEDPSDREGFEWQMSRLEALESVLKDYLERRRRPL